MKHFVPFLMRLKPPEEGEGAEQTDQARGAVVEIYDDIDPYWGMSLTEIAEALNELGDVRRITVRIHSRGGSAMEGFAIYTMFAQHTAFIRVEVIGLAASAASVIAMAGDEVVVSETGHFMIHDPWMYCSGNSANLRRLAEQLDVIRPAILKTYRRRAKASEEQLSEWMSQGGGKGKWFNAEQAVEAGLADSVFEAPVIQNRVFLQDLDAAPSAVLEAFGAKTSDPDPIDELGLREAEAAALRSLIDNFDGSAKVVGTGADRPFLLDPADAQGILDSIGELG